MKYLLITCLFFSALPLIAQEAEKQEKPKPTYCILYLEKPEQSPTEAYLFDGKRAHKILLSNLDFSETIEVPTGIVTVDISPNAIDAAEAFSKNLLAAEITKPLVDLYLFLQKDPKNKDVPIKMKMINVDYKNLMPGHTLWVNLSERKVAAKMGKEEVIVSSKKIMPSFPPLKSSGYFSAEFSYQRDAKDEFFPMMKKSWWFDATSKNLGFIVDTGARMPKIFIVRERGVKKTAPVE